VCRIRACPWPVSDDGLCLLHLRQSNEWRHFASAAAVAHEWQRTPVLPAVENLNACNPFRRPRGRPRLVSAAPEREIDSLEPAAGKQDI
jgi:hypothetical protein